MVSPEKMIAGEVHELLLAARPQADDANLARAAEITLSPDLIAHDAFRANVFLAIRRLQKAIADGASASEVEDLLLDAISAAETGLAGIRRKIGRRVGYREVDDDLPASLTLKTATLFLHGLVAGWAERFHLRSVKRKFPLSRGIGERERFRDDPQRLSP